MLKSRLRSKKGFTLVELLAVIVILAIILAIAIPSITGITKKAKTDSFESTVRMLMKGIDYEILQGSATTVEALNSAGVSAAGGSSVQLQNFTVESINPTTISVEGADGSKFDGCKVTNATITNLTQTGESTADGVISGC